MSASVPQGKTAPRPNGFVCRAGRSFLRRRRKAVRFMKYVGEIWRCAALYRTEQYEKLGIGCYQDQYLVKICEQPGISQEEIAESLFVHKSNVARQVAALEEKGFVEQTNVFCAPIPPKRRRQWRRRSAASAANGLAACSKA